MDERNQCVVESSRGKMRVGFSPHDKTILVATAVEYRDWGIWQEIWYSEEDYAYFFRESTRQVRFSPEVNVILIASIHDYRKWGLAEQIWYNEDDYKRFYLERKQQIDKMRARKLMEFTDSIPSLTNLSSSEGKSNENSEHTDETSEIGVRRFEMYDHFHHLDHPKNSRSPNGVFVGDMHSNRNGDAEERDHASFRNTGSGSFSASKEDDLNCVHAHSWNDEDKLSYPSETRELRK